MEGISVSINKIQNCKDREGNKYYSYVIQVTVDFPFHSWEIKRRFSEFQSLYKFMNENSSRHFENGNIYKISFTKHIKSVIFSDDIAMKRMPILQSHLSFYLSISDLVVREREMLKTFIGFEEYENFARLYRNSGSIISRRSINSVVRDLYPELNESQFEYSNQSANEVEWKSITGDSTDLPTGQSEDVLRITCESFENDFRPTIVNNNSRDYSNNSKNILQQRNHCFISCDNKSRAYTMNVEGLKEAIRNNDTQAIKILLEKKKSLATMCDASGTPLIYTAAILGSIDVAVLLIEHGATPYSTNSNGVCALDVALIPWRKAAITALNAMNQKELCDYFTVSIQLGKYGIGLHLGKSEDDKAVIVGFKTMPVGVTNAALVCDPSLRICDRIISVNDKICETYTDAVRRLRKCSSGSVIKIYFQRLHKNNISSGLSTSS
jgi:hypothetical protein